MKKIMNPEVNFVSLDANDMICTSPTMNARTVKNDSQENFLVGARFSDEYDEEEEW